MLPFAVIIKKEGRNMKKKATNKQKAYIIEYNKNNYRRINFQLHKTNEADLIEYLESQPNINAYLKDLIRKDMGSK